MNRLDAIKKTETVREAAELILPIVCENRDCNHNCAECTEDVVAFLEEDL